MHKILAIDDKKDNLVTLSALLKNLMSDCVVITAQSGKNGIEMVKTEQPDVILLGIIMPDMGGFETCQRLKADESTKHIPVIMITAIKTDSKSRTKGLDLGIDAFISRPIDEVELVSQVKIALRIKRAENALRIEKDSLEQVVAERTRALQMREARLAESNQLLTGVLDHTHMMVVCLDTQFNFIWVNRAYADTYRNEPSFFPGKNYFNLYPHAETQAIFQSVVDSGEPFLLAAKPLTFPDQTERGVTYWNGSLVPLKDTGDKVAGLVFTLMEVTEHKQIEERIVKETARLKTILNLYQLNEKSVEDISSLVIEECIRVSESELGFLGFVNEDETLMKTHLWSKKAMEDCAVDNQPVEFSVLQAGIWAEAIRQHRPFIINNYQSPNPLKKGVPDGHVPIERLLIIPIIKEGRAVAVAAFANKKQDYTESDQMFLTLFLESAWGILERKQAHEELEKSKGKYRAVLDSTPFPIAVIDSKGDKILFWSRSAFSLFGHTAPTALEWYQIAYPDPKYRNDVICRWKLCLETARQSNRTVNTGEYRVTCSDGSVRICELYATFLPENLIVTFNDITERKRSEGALLQAQKMESIGMLAGGIAHDFNNILSPILGYTEMLLEDASEDSLVRDNLNAIYVSSIRAKELVKQILTFSRQEKSETRPMKIQPIVKEAMKMIRSSIPTTINITCEIYDGCGVIKADPTQIHQIVMNLATNAYHAMEETGGELKVGVREIELGEYDVINPEITPGKYVCLTVSDTGVGMDTELTEKIFIPFFTTKKNGKGTGMGLSVIHGIVNSLAGAVHVYSEPGKGTKICVYFPLENKSSVEKPIRSDQPIPGGSEQILLVDDEAFILAMEKQMLQRLGYSVTSRISSIEALEAFRANPDKFDLVITDMTMPNMTGEQLALELTAIRSDIPIILCTGFSENIYGRKTKDTGITRFLMKPIVMADLANTIREAVDKTNHTNQEKVSNMMG